MKKPRRKSRKKDRNKERNIHAVIVAAIFIAVAVLLYYSPAIIDAATSDEPAPPSTAFPFGD